MRPVLLITPAFHGYHRSIARAFAEHGYDVVTHCYDDLNTLADKIHNKALIELPARLGLDTQTAAETRTTNRALRALRETNPGRVVVIKGDSLGHDFWQELEGRKLPRILWLYDDLSRHRYTPDFLRHLGPVVSYARSETEKLRQLGVNASFVPNAFDPNLVGRPHRRSGEIVFVGSRYPNREDLLIRLRDEGLPVRAYGRQWSHHPFDRLRTWDLTRPDIPSHRDIPLRSAYLVQAEAAAAINIHGLQAGVAMRTFEVPGMGGLQLADRHDINEFYDIGKEALVFGNEEELLDLAGRALRDRTWSERIREAGRRRSLAEHTFAHRIPLIEEVWA